MSRWRKMRRSLVTVAGVVGTPLLWFALRIVHFYKKRGTERFPRSLRLYDRTGVYPILDHYYEPLVFPARHLREPLDEIRELPGIDMRASAQLASLRLFDYKDELLAIDRQRTTLEAPCYENNSFETGDAEILHSMVRYYKPRRIVEIGSGESTLFVLNALRLNRLHDPAYTCRHCCIEPYRSDRLRDLDIELIVERVEEVDMSLFLDLQADDILLIDSSHIIRPQGDVVLEYLRIVPALASGVIVHIHDIFTPRDYLAKWIHDERKLWNEQYLVEALLTHNSKLRILLANNYLYHNHAEAFLRAAPVLAENPKDREPGSLWLVVT